MKVTVERTQPRFKRTINGAWLSDTREINTIVMDESQLPLITLGTSNIKVIWADGHTESAFPFNGGAFPGYKPICIPSGGRLDSLLKA